MNKKNDIIIYNSKDGKISVDLYERDGTIWLNQKQIAALFEVNVPAVSKHINNIFEEGELDKNSVVSILETTASDSKNYNVAY